MGRGKTLDPESGIDRHHAILDRGVQADDQGAERVVDRLGGDLAGFDLLGLLGHPRADKLGIELVESNLLELRQQTLTAVDVVCPPCVRLKVWLASTKPAVPPTSECVLSVANSTLRPPLRTP